MAWAKDASGEGLARVRERVQEHTGQVRALIRRRHQAGDSLRQIAAALDGADLAPPGLVSVEGFRMRYHDERGAACWSAVAVKRILDGIRADDEAEADQLPLELDGPELAELEAWQAVAAAADRLRESAAAGLGEGRTDRTLRRYEVEELAAELAAAVRALKEVVD